ncbi:MAG TPA: hypothetical protein EYG03_12380 [Planctomycetes bacterium]|nr:hypothetical protein [Fuerstiella sp.]HIK92760.1 hypothetical protein [Planctomycetota bacterium]
MVHGYHVIMPLYGFWLPNDPRGSWSDFVWKWELVRFGKATIQLERRELCDLTPNEIHRHEAAKRSLNYPPVIWDGAQAVSIANGFSMQCKKSRYSVWACAILPQHVHLVIARHTYAVEQMVRLLKGAATTVLKKHGRHPLKTFAKSGRPPRPWAESHWKVFLDSEEQIETAIRYVEQNPEKEGKPRQHWKFVTPFRGLESGKITYH